MESVEKNGQGKEEPSILDVYQQLLEQQAREADEFLNNKYAPRRQNTYNLFPDDSAFLTFAFINNEIALDQYIKDQRRRQKGIMSGKLKVNYNQEFSNRYIPGKRPIIFPTTSCLARNQMTAAYYHYMTNKTHKEMFAAQILEEIEEFQAYAQQIWRNVNYQRAVNLDPNMKSIIDDYWETKICEAKSLYPSAYGLVNTVPLTLSEEDSKQIHLTHVSDLHSEGSYHQISKIIKVNQEYLLCTNSKDMTSWLHFEQKYPSSLDTTNCLDQDHVAESLAIRSNSQVVMTTSSVKTLLNNHSKNHYATSWMLPVHIKLNVDPNTGMEKKIIFINKKLTHKTLTNAQKLFWFTKLAVKKFCFDYTNGPKANQSERNTMGQKRKKQKNRGMKGKVNSTGADVSCEAKPNGTDVENEESVEIRTNESKDSEIPTASQNTNSGMSDLLEEKANALSETTVDSKANPYDGPSNSNENDSDCREKGSNERVQMKRGCGFSSHDDDSEEEELHIYLSEDELNIEESTESSPISSQVMQIGGETPLSSETSHSNNVSSTMIVDETAKAHHSNMNQSLGTLTLNSNETDFKENHSNVCEQSSIPKPKPLEPIDYSRFSTNGRNKNYTLWRLFKEHTPGSELLKNMRQPLNIIIRSKQDGKKSNAEQGFVRIGHKVEYQCEYGAEVSTLHELLDEWASVYLRPNTDLLRVRVAHDNLEVIMSELRTCADLSHLIQHHYSLNPRHTAGNLYSVLWYLMELPPGRYLLSHEPKNNAFVNVYRADPKGSHLPMAGWHCTEGIGRATWRPIDPSLVMPSHVSSRTLPGLFPPSSQVTAFKLNHKKQKNETYLKHLDDLKAQEKKEINRRKRETAKKKKQKAKDKAAMKQE